MQLQHLHILRPIQYPVANRIQDAVVRQHIDIGLTRQRNSEAARAPPSPFLLTFQTVPTYTCGRREIPSIGPDRINYLRMDGNADFYPALRGGQTTFHGPGQLTAYLVITLSVHNLTPRCYVRFLENAVIDLCTGFGVPTRTTRDPGVWLDRTEGYRGNKATGKPLDSKICAVGVHMRRGVTSHGIGLNVNTNLGWFERITACGLVGKRVTSLEEVGIQGLGVREVAMLFASNVARDLEGVDGINVADLAGNTE